MSSPKKYRLVKVGEFLKSTDEVKINASGDWWKLGRGFNKFRVRDAKFGQFPFGWYRREMK